MYLISRLWEVLVGWFSPHRVADQLVEINKVVLDTPPPVVRAPSTEDMPGLVAGRALLDHIDEYFEVFRVLRRYSGEAFRSMMKYGAYLTAQYIDGRDEDVLNEHWRAGMRPNFGAVLWHIDVFKDNYVEAPSVGDAEKFFRPALALFEKQTVDGAYALTSGDVYMISMVYPMPKKKEPMCLQFYVSVGSDCRVKLLKQKIARVQRLPRARGRDSVVRHVEYAYPSYLLKHFRENGSATDDAKCIELTENWARGTLNAFVDNSVGLVARVRSPDGLFGNFVVPMEHVAQAFPPRTRDTGGRRIFHVVRVHQRSNGSFVKCHFRGERFFTFGVYGVEIFLPGKHRGAHAMEFDIESHEDRKGAEKMLTGEEAIERLIARGAL